jgi:hypothetical protein
METITAESRRWAIVPGVLSYLSTLAQRRAIAPLECKERMDIISSVQMPKHAPRTVREVQRCVVRVVVSMQRHVVSKWL